MTLALLYDVHGNLPALEAVLADAQAAGARRHLLGGDYALFGGWPADTIARLAGLQDAAWLRGNGERWCVAPQDAPGDEPVPEAIAACREALGDERVQRLAELPEQLVLDGVRYCHASPVSDVRSFLPAPGPDDEELAAGVSEPRLVFGHTHLPFRRPGPGGVELVNPGSVGMPFDGDPRASYALLHAGGELEHRRVSYDHEAAARGVRERFAGTWTEIVARRIERAGFD